MKKPWIAFFSQTGAEIADLAEKLGRWPDMIVTNRRPAHLRTIDSRVLRSGCLYECSNNPTEPQYRGILNTYEEPIITLHGWLRIIPPTICKDYSIFNGHPGLITKYPELKGKDPQVRAYEGIKVGLYKEAGTVIHKVTEGVDEGKVLAVEKFNAENINLDELFQTLRDRSLYLWVQLLTKAIN